MASQTRQAREADRKLSVQTLAIASLSSALAAIIVSQFWKSGTAPAAAITPVVITVLSELLHKPTKAITSRVTGERTALLPEGAGAGAPTQKTEVAVGAPAADHEASRPAAEEPPPPLRDDDGEAVPSDQRKSREAPISYHKAGSNGAAPEGWRKRINLKIVAATAALAFLIGAAVLTVPELIAGGSVGKTSGGTTLFGGDRSSDTNDAGTETDSQSQDQSDEPEQPQRDQSSPESGSGSDAEKRTTTEQNKPKTQTEQQPQQRQAPAPSKTPAQP